MAGVAVNLLFALVAFVLIYSVIGFDLQNQETGLVQHVTVSPLRAVEIGFMYIGMVVQAVARRSRLCRRNNIGGGGRYKSC